MQLKTVRLFLLSFFQSTTVLASDSATVSLTPWESIHQTLHIYALAIDSKQFNELDQVFAQNAFANYTGPLSNLTDLSQIKQGLSASVANLLSQHELGTTVINIHPDNQKQANSTTYFIANLFGNGNKYPTSEHVFLYGQYQDSLALLKQGWRIERRQLVFMAPPVGNQSLLGG